MARKKSDDLGDVIREERSRGSKRPIDVNAIRNQQARRKEVLEIFQNGTRADLQALLNSWGYSKEQIEVILGEFDSARDQRSS
jgi:hypothetical protein